MANKKISELQSRTPALSDLMIVGDPSSGYSYKCTVTALATIIETDIADGFVTIGTTQTISGAKTFSNNLTLTSVANTPTDPDKFLTLNASNVVTYRTGAEVLSDIGGQGSITLTTTGTSGAATLVGNTLNIPQYQAVLSGTGIVKSTGGTISYLTDNSTNWNSAYDNMIVSAAVTGTTTKTLTLTQQDSGTITASWTDDNSGTVTSVGLSAGTSGTDVNVSGSPITSSGTITLNIPTASATNRGALSSTDWSTFNNKQSAITLTTTGSSGSATFVSNTLNVPTYTLAGLGGISGSGTTNYIPKFTSSSAIGNSAVTDDGTTVTLVSRALSGTSATFSSNVTATNLILSNGNNLTWGGVYGAGIPTIVGYNDGGGGNLYFYPSGSTSGEKMRLNASGNLSIGNTNNTYKLDVTGRGNFTNNGEALRLISSDANGNYITFQNSSAVYGYIGSAYQLVIPTGSASDLSIRSQANLVFNSGGATERMRLDASGNLGLGTSNPLTRLHIQGNNTTGKGQFVISSASAGQEARMTFVDGSDDIAEISTDGNDLYFYNEQATGKFLWYTGGSLRATLDASGNLGLGVTPSAWGSGYTALQIENTGFMADADRIWMYANGYFNGGDNIYIQNGFASRYYQANGQHIWENAPSGTAGNAISFTQAMTLDASGRLGIGLTSPASSLDVLQEIRVSYANANQYRVRIYNTDGNGRIFVDGNETSLIFGTSPVGTNATATEKMRITSGGNVQIGTSSSSGAKTFIYDNRSNSSSVDEASLYIRQDGTNAIQTWAGNGGTERMRITSGGLVGIGISNPNANDLISVVGNSSLINTSYKSSPRAAGYMYWRSGGDASERNVAVASIAGWDEYNGGQFNGSLKFYTQTSNSLTEKMQLTSSGELLINTTSDAGDYKLQVNGNVRTGGLFDVVAGSTASFALTVDVNSSFAFGSTNGKRTAIIRTTSAEDNGLQFGYDTIDNTGIVAGAGTLNGAGIDFYTYNGTSWGNRMRITKAGNIEANGSIKTAAPSGGTAKPWKLGEAGVTLGGSNTSGVRVEIDGVVYYLVTGYLP